MATRVLFAVSSLASCQELFLASSSTRVPPNPSSWAALTSLLKGWEFTTEYALTIGTPEHGRLFSYEGGNFTLETSIPTGSTSKWPSAMMVAGLVEDGTIHSFDDPVSKYLQWWTTNASDPRSTVTVRMLLSFTSGFGGGSPGAEVNTRAGREWRQKHDLQRRDEPALPGPCNVTTGDITECARSIYDTVELIGQPGTVFSYNSNHLQMAAALAVQASGLDVQAVVKKYLLEPFNMTQSFYFGKCPDFGANLVTTGNDYEQFLQGMLGYRSRSRRTMLESERDYTPFMSQQYTLYGNYGFGHYLACFDSVAGFTAECKDAQVHIDPGAFGFIPLYDRRYNYYMQLVAAEIPPTGTYALSGIPEYLAIAIKSVVDDILSPEPSNPMSYLYHTPEHLSLSVADVNYCLGCKLHPETCA